MVPLESYFQMLGMTVRTSIQSYLLTRELLLLHMYLVAGYLPIGDHYRPSWLRPLPRSLGHYR